MAAAAALDDDDDDDDIIIRKTMSASFCCGLPKHRSSPQITDLAYIVLVFTI